MYLFVIPFYYTYKTRLKNVHSFVSWGMIYVVLLMLYIITRQDFFDLYTIVIFILAIILAYNNYEVGYIYNDAETIKKENKPTMRLNETQLLVYESNKTLIYAFRLLIGLSVSLFMVYKDVGMIKVFVIWGILPVFFIYNIVRSRLNLVLHFVLVMLRYLSPVLIVVNTEHLVSELISIALIFPVCNLIERCSEKRFNISFFVNLNFNVTKWRIIYYFSIVLVTSVLLYPLNNEFLSLLYCSLYMLTYRLISPVVIKLS